MAAPPSFPAPPDLSELLKFFASPSYDHSHALSTSSQQPSIRRHRDDPASERQSNRRTVSSAPAASTQRQRPHGNRMSTQEHRNKAKPSSETARTQSTTTLATAQRRRGSPPKEPAPSVANDWNGSTQIPATAAKPLKHQILDRTYMPPAPVVVDASGATHLVKRLSKTTISSRLKRHQADEEATALAAASAALAGAFERRSRHSQSQKQNTNRTRLQGDEDDEIEALGPSPAVVPSPPDSRARRHPDAAHVPPRGREAPD